MAPPRENTYGSADGAELYFVLCFFPWLVADAYLFLGFLIFLQRSEEAALLPGAAALVVGKEEGKGVESGSVVWITLHSGSNLISRT